MEGNIGAEPSRDLSADFRKGEEMAVKVEFSAKLPVKFVVKSNWVVATCPILDISSQGKTEKIAKKHLKEALSLFFRSCFERGTLEAVLKQCGFKAVEPEAIQTRSKRSIVDKENYINIPIPFLVNQSPQVECHA